MEENDGNKEVNRAKDRSPSPGVKSTAVVKYTAVQSPVHYSQLQCNTDLNTPPSNWGAAVDSYGLKQIMTEESGFSSFRMAHMFPDVVGNVDVIAGAECIKTLLKIPYQPNGTVSMMVHRVENTLLLDNFDVYDYLMKSEWSWLKDFFYENILKTMSEKDKMTLSIENKPSSALQLTNKFLCHSVASQPKNETAPVPVCLDAPLQPHPEPPPPPQEHLYNRNVLWTFEDIHMLIGSDLPIFGGDDRPCVSLRLRDANEPINVLTGIDYWLDNLMCNVPEVLMCYHLDGIVQQYEPLKTEDLPQVDHARFSPKVIRNVAQNILSFLKSNATKAGHTYWLFKGPRDDVVKLYDLTSLCPAPAGAPFTAPVAMLLYRVARNMRLNNRTRHVKQLLENALKLLKPETHPQICASARYMLAELHVPVGTDPAAPQFHEDSSSDNEDDDLEPEFQENEECGPLVQARGLALRDIGRASEKTEQKAKSDKDGNNLGTSPPDRCGSALKQALEGLLALRHITVDKCKEEERERLRQQIIIEEQHPKMANPYEPIRMNYEPIRKNQIVKEHQSRSRRKKRERKTSENNLIKKKDKNAILIRKETSSFPSKHDPDKNDNYAWKLHLKTLLYENICLSYATLAEFSYSNEQYGFSLKYIDMASKCQKLLSNLIIRSRVVDASCLIGRVGDNYFQLSKHWSALEKFRKQFETDHDIDKRLRIEIENDMIEETDGAVKGDEFDLEISLPSSETESMQLSLSHYSLAMRASTRRSELARRLASVHNELAVRTMHNGQQIFAKYQEEVEKSDETSSEAQMLLDQIAAAADQSWQSLVAAADLFEQVNDVPNLALLHCNKARYMRFKAHCTAGITESERRKLYSEAEDEYQSALKLIGGQDLPVKDLVLWELSCHLTTRACRMQDEPEAYEANEVSAALKQALKSCVVARPGARLHLYQFRAALLQHRLASLHHAMYRQTTEEGPKRRSLFAATRGHYEQAAAALAALEDAPLYLTVRLEHVALLETQAAVSPSVKLKSLQTALQLLRQCQSIMKLIIDRDEASKPDESDESNIKNEHNLLSLFENRLNHILKSVIQYCRSKSNKDYERLTDVYKKLYCASLKIKKSDDIKDFARSVYDVLVAMNEIDKEVSL